MKKFLQSNKLPLVVKADGIAAGKGVMICKKQKEEQWLIDEHTSFRDHLKIRVKKVPVIIQMGLFLCRTQLKNFW